MPLRAPTDEDSSGGNYPYQVCSCVTVIASQAYICPRGRALSYLNWNMP
jgi:hypothetical protein